MKTPEQLAATLLPKMGQERFTVVVEYPHHMQEAHCPITYVAHVCASDSREAARVGRKQAQMAQENEHRGAETDWLPLVVFHGHHDIREHAR